MMRGWLESDAQSPEGGTANVIVWLWDSSGPAGEASGITDDEAQARRAAEKYMRTVQACTARVERAHLRIGIHALTPGYERTGKGWSARQRRNGYIAWTSFADRELTVSRQAISRP